MAEPSESFKKDIETDNRIEHIRRLVDDINKKVKVGEELYTKLKDDKQFMDTPLGQVRTHLVELADYLKHEDHDQTHAHALILALDKRDESNPIVYANNRQDKVSVQELAKLRSFVLKTRKEADYIRMQLKAIQSGELYSRELQHMIENIDSFIAHIAETDKKFAEKLRKSVAIRHLTKYIELRKYVAGMLKMIDLTHEENLKWYYLRMIATNEKKITLGGKVLARGKDPLYGQLFNKKVEIPSLSKLPKFFDKYFGDKDTGSRIQGIFKEYEEDWRAGLNLLRQISEMLGSRDRIRMIEKKALEELQKLLTERNLELMKIIRQKMTEAFEDRAKGIDDERKKALKRYERIKKVKDKLYMEALSYYASNKQLETMISQIQEKEREKASEANFKTFGDDLVKAIDADKAARNAGRSIQGYMDYLKRAAEGFMDNGKAVSRMERRVNVVIDKMDDNYKEMERLLMKVEKELKDMEVEEEDIQKLVGAA